MLPSVVSEPSSLFSRFQRWVNDAWNRWLSPVETGGESEEEIERRLIREVKQGGTQAQKAFRELVETHQRWLTWFLTCLLSNQADAEDVAQEVFVRAFLSIDRFRGDAKFRTWIRRIAINQAFNHRRAKGRHAAVEFDETWEKPSYDRHKEALAARDTLMHCLEQLPYVSREVLVLYHVEELSVQEVANSLEIGVSAAKMRIKRARDNFKEVFQADLEQEAIP